MSRIGYIMSDLMIIIGLLIFVWVIVVGLTYCIADVDVFDFVIEKVMQTKNKKIELLRQKAKNNTIKMQRKQAMRFGRKKEALLIPALRYEYYEYVKIVEKVLNEICDKSITDTNELYLMKLNENFYKIDANIYDISGIICFYDAIFEYPVINEINDETKRLNKEFIKKIMEYTFFEEYTFSNGNKINVYDKKEEIYQSITELLIK